MSAGVGVGENAYILSHTSYGPKMENELVCRIVLRWLFECYDPPDIAPARVEGAEFDPQFIWREQWQRLLEALHPPPRPPAPRPPLISFRRAIKDITESDLEATLE